MPALLLISVFFFTFPLFAPAVGMVLYPYLLQGAAWAARTRIPQRHLPALVVLTAAGLSLGLADPASFTRILAFLFGLVFLVGVTRDPGRLRFLLKLGFVHAWIVVAQWCLVVAGLPIDFSEVLRALYGGLLPPTGVHIDYNAFSQWDVFFPRVAGLSREPAFASLLFIGLLFIAMKLKQRKLAVAFGLAILCTLSKVVFPILLAMLLSSLSRRDGRVQPWLRFLRNLLAFVAAHAVVVTLIGANVELVEAAMALDASFYHRFIGLHTLYTQWDQLAWFGNSFERISADPIFASYEFVDDRRAFLDGSVASKLAVDFGYAGLVLYAIAAAAICRNASAAMGLALGGMFINLISVSPATLLTFWILSGLHAGLPSALAYRTRHSRDDRRRPDPVPFPPQSKVAG